MKKDLCDNTTDKLDKLKDLINGSQLFSTQYNNIRSEEIYNIEIEVTSMSKDCKNKTHYIRIPTTDDCIFTFMNLLKVAKTSYREEISKQKDGLNNLIGKLN